MAPLWVELTATFVPSYDKKSVPLSTELSQIWVDDVLHLLKKEGMYVHIYVHVYTLLI